MTPASRSFTLSLKAEHFEEVKENLEIGAGRSLSDDDVMAFLRRHVNILGSIIHHDEVDTVDRGRIWEEQMSEERLA